MINLDERFAQTWAGEPAQAAPSDYLSSGRRARRRRRVGSAVAAAAVVGVLAGTIGIVTGQGDSPGTDPHTQVADAPAISQDDYPVKEWPPTQQGVKGGESVQVWIDSDGTIYRTRDSVEVTGVAEVAPIRDATTAAKVGFVKVVRSREGGKDSGLTAEIAHGKVMATSVIDDATKPGPDHDLPLYWMKTPDGGSTIFSAPVGITGSGQLDPVTDKVSIVQQGPAATFSTRRFDAAPPTAGIVEFQGRRYFALAGHRADGHDVIVSELARGRTLDAWLTDVKQRMDSGALLG